MRTLLVAVACMFGLALPAFAGSAYDWRSGNMYNWNTMGGDTQVNGLNLNTGSQWNTTIRSNGDMNGFDGSGNYWNYNAGTGAYFSTNGTTCVGHGAARICN